MPGMPGCLSTETRCRAPMIRIAASEYALHFYT